MIQEANFNDIRRNFILALILLILFLLYWTGIKIEQLLIFKFDIKWEWAIISPYWDIFIILIIFFFYTLARYYIYWIQEINKSQYNRIFLLEFLKKLSSEDSNKIKDNVQSFLQKSTKNNPEKSLIIEDCSEIHIEIDNYDEKLYFWIFAKNSQWGQLIWERYNIPDSWRDIIISKNGFSFKNIVMLFNNKNIWKKYWPNFISLVFKKEFSDLWWPLLLMIPLSGIILMKLIKFFYCL